MLRSKLANIKMNSLQEISNQISKLTEAIALVSVQAAHSVEAANELVNLSNRLNEQVYLLRFAHQLLASNTVKALASPEKASNIEQEIALNAGEQPDIETEEILETEADDKLTEANMEETLETDEVLDVDEEEEDKNKINLLKAIESVSNEIGDKESVNDKIAKASKNQSLINKLELKPIDNLKTAIGLNERFLFANELFKGDGQEYTLAIEEFNHLTNIDDAYKLINHKYVEKYKWDLNNKTVKIFLNYVERRFMSKAS